MICRRCELSYDPRRPVCPRCGLPNPYQRSSTPVRRPHLPQQHPIVAQKVRKSNVTLPLKQIAVVLSSLFVVLLGVAAWRAGSAGAEPTSQILAAVPSVAQQSALASHAETSQTILVTNNVTSAQEATAAAPSVLVATAPAAPTDPPTPVAPAINPVAAPIVEDPPQPSTPEPTEAPRFVKAPGTYRRNEIAEFSLIGVPGEVYSITIYSPKGNALKAQGLEPHVADANGYVQWNWQVGRNTSFGTGSITICDSAGQAVLRAPYEIVQ